MERNPAAGNSNSRLLLVTELSSAQMSRLNSVKGPTEPRHRHETSTRSPRNTSSISPADAAASGFLDADSCIQNQSRKFLTLPFVYVQVLCTKTGHSRMPHKAEHDLGAQYQPVEGVRAITRRAVNENVNQNKKTCSALRAVPLKAVFVCIMFRF